jgi:hypothetical protein
MRISKATANRVRKSISNGMSNADIKIKFGISSHSLYMIRHRMLKKLNAEPMTFVSPITNKPVIVKPDAVQVGGDHYKDNRIQVWDAIHDWNLGYFSGNVVKYVARHTKKGGLEDLKKARHYLDKLIAVWEAKAQ